MKKIFFLAAMALISTGVFAQQTIKSDNVANFSAVSLSGNLRVELIAADKNEVEVVLHNADITKFKWGVENGTISMSLRPSGEKGRADVKIYYSRPLSDISISGVELSAKETIESDILHLSAGSGAKASLDVSALDLELEATGNSAVQLSGSAKYFTLRATEKSRVNTLKMEAVSVVAETTMSSEVHVNVNERLVANAKTGSTIFYKGSPVVFKDKSSKMNTNMMGSSVLNIGH